MKLQRLKPKCSGQRQQTHIKNIGVNRGSRRLHGLSVKRHPYRYHHASKTQPEIIHYARPHAHSDGRAHWKASLLNTCERMFCHQLQFKRHVTWAGTAAILMKYALPKAAAQLSSQIPTQTLLLFACTQFHQKEKHTGTTCRISRCSNKAT